MNGGGQNYLVFRVVDDEEFHGVRKDSYASWLESWLGDSEVTSNTAEDRDKVVVVAWTDEVKCDRVVVVVKDLKELVDQFLSIFTRKSSESVQIDVIGGRFGF